MSVPAQSPMYLLLTSPSWGGTKAFESVLKGLRGDWEFDPNETHDGVSIVGGLLNQWSSQNLGDARLISVLGELISRGADPARALDEAELGNVSWQQYSAAHKMLIAAASGKDLGIASLGAQLQNIASQGLNIQDANQQILALLATKQDWDTRIDGIRALSWLALNSCKEGEMQGWPTGRHTTSDANVRKMRLLRHLALSSNAADHPDPVDRFLTGCGMLMLASYYRSTSGESDSSAALENVAGKVLKGLNLKFVDIINSVATSSEFDDTIKAQVGMSVALGLIHFVEDPAQSWEVFAAAIPLMYLDGEFLGGSRTFANALQAERGAPPASFWSSLPHDGISHDVMLRILLCSYQGQNYHNDTSKTRLILLDQMQQWASDGALPEFDMGKCKAWAACHQFTRDTVMNGRLDEYQDIIRVSYVSATLQGETPMANPTRPRTRL